MNTKVSNSDITIRLLMPLANASGTNFTSCNITILLSVSTRILLANKDCVDLWPIRNFETWRDAVSLCTYNLGRWSPAVTYFQSGAKGRDERNMRRLPSCMRCCNRLITETACVRLCVYRGGAGVAAEPKRCK